MIKPCTPALLLAGLLGTLAPAAHAGGLEFLFDSAAVTRTPDDGPFSGGYTGSLTVADDDDTVIADILRGPNAAPVSVIDELIGSLISFHVEFTFVGGAVTGGSLEIVIDADDTPGGLTDRYTAQLVATPGAITDHGDDFSIWASTGSGLFEDGDADGRIGGVEAWWFTQSNSNGALPGWIHVTGYDGSALDADASVLVHAPTPSAASAALGLGALLLLARRRR